MFEPYRDGKKTFKRGGYSMKAFDVPHDGIDNFGVFLLCPDGHKILYLTDLEFCKYTFKKLKVNTIIVECNYQKQYLSKDEVKANHVLRGHMSEETCIEFIKANQTEDLKNVVLCHLSQGSCDPNEVLVSVQEAVGKSVNVVIARKGVELTL